VSHKEGSGSPTGEIAKLANRRTSRNVVHGANITIATLIGIGLSIVVESFGDWSQLAVRLGLTAALIAAVFGARRWAVARLRRNAKLIGSFFYVSALRKTQTDRDRLRFRRAMDHLGQVRNIDGVVNDALVFEEVTEEELVVGTSIADAVDRLCTSFRYAARNDRDDLPTNLVVNAAWPIAVAFGYQLSDALLNTGPTGSVRVWHLPPASKIGSIPFNDSGRNLEPSELLAGEMIDVGELQMLPRPDRREPTPRPHGGDALLIIHETTEGKDPARVLQVWQKLRSELHNPVHFEVELRDHPVTPANFSSIESFLPMAHEIAGVIADYRETVEGRLFLSLRVPKEVAVTVGVLLAHWKIDLSRCELIAPPESDHAAHLDVWKFALGHSESAGGSSPPSEEAAPPTLAQSVALVNLTPHDIRVLDDENNPVHLLVASGVAARVSEAIKESQSCSVTASGGSVVVDTLEYGALEGLPPPREATLYVVSRVTAEQARDRKDLIFPLGEVRRGGTVIGCRRFGRLK